MAFFELNINLTRFLNMFQTALREGACRDRSASIALKWPVRLERLMVPAGEGDKNGIDGTDDGDR